MCPAVRTRFQRWQTMRWRGWARGGCPPGPALGAPRAGRIGGVAMPTLVIHGETDQRVPAENGRIIAGAIPRSQLVMIPHASHIFFTDQLEASSEALLAFLEAPASA